MFDQYLPLKHLSKSRMMQCPDPHRPCQFAGEQLSTTEQRGCQHLFHELTAPSDSQGTWLGSPNISNSNKAHKWASFRPPHLLFPESLQSYHLSSYCSHHCKLQVASTCGKKTHLNNSQCGEACAVWQASEYQRRLLLGSHLICAPGTELCQLSSAFPGHR